MDLCGLMKLTLLDYPGRVACTVFTGGCNFRCPFCHNTSIVMKNSQAEISTERFLLFLTKRKGILDGVCVSGGEPLANADLPELLKSIKELGYSVKLDTNGSFPDRLREIADNGLCDCVAMDIKNSPQKYALTAGTDKIDIGAIKESIEYIKHSGIEHEFRTTVVREFHTPADIREATALIKGEKKYFLQPFRSSDGVLVQGLHEPEHAELDAMLDAAREFVPGTELRGI